MAVFSAVSGEASKHVSATKPRWPERDVDPPAYGLTSPVPQYVAG